MIAAFLLLAAAEAEACGPGLEMRYAESSPLDVVWIRHLSPDGWQVERVVWRLEGSSGALMFDTVAGGEGAGSAGGFDGWSGPVRLADLPLIADGGGDLTLSFEEFAAGAEFSFGIDLDSRIQGAASTVVSLGDMAGAAVAAEFRHVTGIAMTLTGNFGPDSRAVLKTPCTS